MLMLKYKRMLCAAMSAALLLSPMASMTALAGPQQDTQLLAMKAELIKAMQAGATQSVAQQQANDNAARSSQECANIKDKAQASATQMIDLHRPPDPSKIIQNTTCMVDVSTVKIPISMTGLPFLDTLISTYLQQYLTGSCAKGQTFLADLQKSSLSQLNTSTGGAASSIGGALGGTGSMFSYASGTPVDLASLQAAGAGYTNGLISTAATAPPDSATTAAAAAVKAATAASSKAASASTALMCQYGIPNDQFCPTCVTNPMNPSCLGPKPYCGQFPNVSEPLCQPVPVVSSTSGGGGSGGGSN